MIRYFFVFLGFYELLVLSYIGLIFNFFENMFFCVCEFLKILYFVMIFNYILVYFWGF